MTAAMQERLRAIGPKMMAETLSRFLLERGGARAGDHHLPGVEPRRRSVEFMVEVAMLSH